MASQLGKLLLLAALSLVSFFIGLSTGPLNTPPEVVLGALAHAFQGPRGLAERIVLYCRLPRTLAGFLVGACLSLSGLMLQSLTRNPLADPYLLGVSSGALVGSGLALLALPYVTWLPPSLLVTTAAFLGALLAFTATFILSEATGGTVYSLVLAGLAVSAGLSGLSILISLLVQVRYGTVVHWLMGSLASATWREVIPLTAVFLPSAVVSLLAWRRLDAIILGEDHSAVLGYSPSTTRRLVSVLVALMTGVSVSVAGVIGFIGLIAPHMVRMIIGSSHRHTVPASIMLGGSMLVIADAVARSAVIPWFPGEVPVGALMSVIGAPVFAYLMLRVARGSGTR